MLVLAALCLQSSHALAAAHLTLPEVVQKVVLSNPEVLSKWHTFRSSEGEVDVARAGFLPKIDYTYGTGSESLNQPGVAARNFSRSGHTLTLNQMLFDGYATSSDVRRLDKARLTRYFELIDAAENAALEAGRAYYDVMRYRMLLLLAEANYVEHRASYEQLLRRAQSGAGRRVDVEHAASRLALAELNLHTEAANLHDVMARFIRLVGEPPPQVMFPPSGLSRNMPGSEADAIRSAFRQNPALRAAIENLESAQHDADLRRASLYPRLDLRMRNESSDNYQGTAGTRKNNIAELVLSYNLFNGGADMARQKVYAERKYLAQDLRNKACRDIRQTLSIAYNDVERLKSQLSNLDLQVGAIEKTRDAYKAQFNIGQRSLLDLLDTENELLNARRTAVNSDMDLGIAYLRTQAGIGRLMEFLGVRPRGLDDAIEREMDHGGELCPPYAPGSYLVDLEALKARAMASLEAGKPPAPAPARAPAESKAPSAPAGANLSLPPPMPAPGRSSGSNPGALRPPPPPVEGNAGVARAVARGVPEQQGTPSAARPTPAAGTEAGAVAAAGAARADATAEEQIRLRMASWAQAWSSGSVDRYLTFYAPDFVPADGRSRADWVRQRESRINPGAGIDVGVSDLSVSSSSPNQLLVEFVQKYRSRTFKAKNHKALRWTKVGSEWLIDREFVSGTGSRAVVLGKAVK